MKKPNEIIEKVPEDKRKHILTFAIFLILSSSLWLLTKLSKDYSTQSTFKINYIDVPTDQCITSDTTKVNFSFDADGFVTLKHNLLPKEARIINISLNEVPYHNDNGNDYSYSSQYIAEKLAHLLNISTSNISMNEASISFKMEKLKSKKVKVVLNSEIETQRQYGIHGNPMVSPNEIVVYGPSKIIDTLTAINTTKLTKSNVSSNIDEMVPLDMHSGLKTDSTEVNVKINIEKFTELNIEIPIKLSKNTGIRLLPETVKVKCMVPMSDYNNITAQHFDIGIDETQIGTENVTDIVVRKTPDNIVIKNISPEQIEYLIVK